MEYNDFCEDLNEFLVEQEASEFGINIEDENFRVLNEEQANFMLRRLSELKFEEDKLNAECDRNIQAHADRVNLFREQKLSGIQGAQNYFKSMLEDFARNETASTGKKSCKLAYGTLQFRKVAPKFVYNDVDLMEYVSNENNGLAEYINETTVKKVDKTRLKKAVTIEDGLAYINGQAISGIEVEPETQKFDLKL